MNSNFTLEVQAGLFQVSEDEIKSAIPQSTLDEIRKTNPSPKFVAYVVAQEGTATPKILTGQSKPIVVLSNAIRQIVQAIKGTKLFKNHNSDNSTKGRTPYGEVVGTLHRTIDGKESAIAIAYVHPEKEDAVKSLDVLSLEGSLSLIDQGAQYLLDSVSAITGLAIGSSKDWEPAFSGARQIAMIQALNGEPMSENANLSFHDLKRIKDERRVHPSQLYSAEEIFGRPVKDSKGNIRYVGGDVLLVEQAETFTKYLIDEKTEELRNKVSELEAKLGETTKLKNEYFSKAIRQEWVPQLSEKAKDKKFTDKALTLLAIEVRKVEIPEDEKEREQLGERILSEVAEKHKELFGAGTDEQPPETKGDAPKDNPFLIK